MKFILCLLSATLLTYSAISQDIKYQFEIESGIHMGLRNLKKDYLRNVDFGSSTIPLHIINGIRINKYVFVGLGVGCNFLLNQYSTESEWILYKRTYPIYINAKGYLPINNLVKIFLSLDIGGFIEERREIGGFMTSPSIGISFALSRNADLNFSFGYNYQGWRAPISIDDFSRDYPRRQKEKITIDDNSLLVKIGMNFKFSRSGNSRIQDHGF